MDGQDATVKICLDDNGHALIKSAVTYQSGHIPRVGNHKVKEVEKELYCQICEAIDRQDNSRHG